MIHITRDFLIIAEALALYHRSAKTLEDYIELSLKEPDFFINIKRRHDLLNKEIKDPRFLRIALEDWNNFLTQTFDKLLDFLEFPKENRLKLVPVKVDRDFEAYSCSHISKDAKVCNRLEVLRSVG